MANIKISFSIEIDGVNIINHVVQRDEKQHSFDLERTLSLEIINRLKTLYTDREIFHQPWADVEKIKEQNDARNIPFSMKEYL